MSDDRFDPGARILVVEDEYYLAADLSDVLTENGAVVMGPFADADAAIAAAERTAPTMALVDINLGSGPSFATPRYLKERGIPFAFITGYEESAVPPEFAAVPRLEKPASAAAIRRVAARLLTAAPV